MSRAVTGTQYTLRGGNAARPVEATITGVAAALRGLRVGGVDIVAGYGPQQTPPSASGITLAPWPNRVADGRWTAPDGSQQQLDISEPARNNAIHGLVRFTEFTAEQPADELLVLRTTIHPQHGYPFLIELEVEYRLVDDGIVVEYRVHNVGEHTAPFAIGAHPFVTIGGVPAQQLRVQLNCTSQLVLDPERMVPVERRELPAAEGLRAGVRLSELEADDAFADPILQGGRSQHTLTADDGRAVEVWGDEHFGYWQVFTSRSYPGQEVALAIEPMTAPGNAFVSGDGVIMLGADEHVSMRWGITLHQG